MAEILVCEAQVGTLTLTGVLIAEYTEKSKGLVLPPLISRSTALTALSRFDAPRPKAAACSGP